MSVLPYSAQEITRYKVKKRRAATRKNMAKRERKKLHKGIAILLVVLLVLVTGVGVFCAGTVYQSVHWDFWYPDYEKVDIEPLLDKPLRTEEEYALLYAQTGLTELGIEDTLLQQDGKKRILEIQDCYFKDAVITRDYDGPIMYQEGTNVHPQVAHLQEGDVLVSASTVVSWWRFGHCGLVVDGDRGILLESIGMGNPSRYEALEDFTVFAGFMVLRPRADVETKRLVVEYAKNNLVGLPYMFTVGLLSKKNPKNIKSTQCAHLVWYAYKQFGLDLDSDGGGVVLPQDIANSSNVEVVQIFGLHPERLWK